MESVGRSRKWSGGSYDFKLPPGGTALVTAISERFFAESVFIGPLVGIHQKTAPDAKLNPCQMDPEKQLPPIKMWWWRRLNF
jgi:hypothetical protein